VSHPATPPRRLTRRVGLQTETILYCETVEQFAYHAPAVAKALPVYDGDVEKNIWIVRAARWYIENAHAMAILSRDNMVKLGFWKNFEFENCVHLSVSFRAPGTFEPLGWNERVARQIAGAVFGRDVRKTWWEPAYTEGGKTLSVGHFRLFYDPMWASSIVPKGEPYSVSSAIGGTSMSLWTEAQADLPTPHFAADITDELPLRRQPASPTGDTQ
jgi:hypothetical protein